MRGKLITFEGGEGSGKSTQARLLADGLRARGLGVQTTREPGGSEFAEAARAIVLDPRTAPKSPLAAALLFYAARADHLEELIRPALEDGQWVICDRFADSTRAYQGAAGGVAARDLELIDRLVVGKTQPDLTFLLDLAPDIGLARAGQRRVSGGDSASPPDAYEQRQIEFHERLRQGFLELAASNANRIVVIDAAAATDVIAQRIAAVVAARLGNN